MLYLKIQIMTTKCIIINLHNSRRNCKSAIIYNIESPTSYFCNTCRNCCFRTSNKKLICYGLNNGIAIITGIVYSIVLCNLNRCDITRPKSINSYTCNTCWKFEGGQSCTSCKSIIVNSSYRIGNRDRCDCINTIKCTLSNFNDGIAFDCLRDSHYTVNNISINRNFIQRTV